MTPIQPFHCKNLGQSRPFHSLSCLINVGQNPNSFILFVPVVRELLNSEGQISWMVIVLNLMVVVNCPRPSPTQGHVFLLKKTCYRLLTNALFLWRICSQLIKYHEISSLEEFFLYVLNLSSSFKSFMKPNPGHLIHCNIFVYCLGIKAIYKAKVQFYIQMNNLSVRYPSISLL